MKRFEKNESYIKLSDQAKLIYKQLALSMVLIPNFEISNENLNILFGYNDSFNNKVKRYMAELRESELLTFDTSTEQIGLKDFKSKRIIKITALPKYATLSDKLSWYFSNFLEEVK